MRFCFALIAVLAIAACGAKEDPVGSEHSDLVGTWRAEATDLSGFERVIITALVSIGTDESEARAAWNEMVADSYTNPTFSHTIRFESDFTWSDSDGDSGTWSVAGNILAVKSKDGIGWKMAYFVDGNRLTLTMDGSQIQEVMIAAAELEPDPDLTAAEQAQMLDFFRGIFDAVSGETMIRQLYLRTS